MRVDVAWFDGDELYTGDAEPVPGPGFFDGIACHPDDCNKPLDQRRLLFLRAYPRTAANEAPP